MDGGGDGDVGIDGIGGDHGGGFDCIGHIDGFGDSDAFAGSSGFGGAFAGDAGDGPEQGVVHAKDAIAFAVGPHGALDVKAVFSRLAMQAGLISIGSFRPQLEPVDKTEFEILNKYGGKPGSDGTNMPGGWYPGATGWTRLWRTFWQLGNEPMGFRSDQSLRRFAETRTYLSVASITWAYGEALDQQTLLVIRLISLPVHKLGEGWLIDSESWERHHNAGHKVAEQLCEILKEADPDELAVINRRRISEQTSQEDADAQEKPDTSDGPDAPCCGRQVGTHCSGADLANLIPGFGLPSKDGKCPAFELIVDPDAFPDPECRRGGGSADTVGGASSPGPGYGEVMKDDPRLEADHDPYFDSRAKDPSECPQDQTDQPDFTDADYDDAGYED